MAQPASAHNQPLEVMLDQVNWTEYDAPDRKSDIPYATHEGILWIGSLKPWKLPRSITWKSSATRAPWISAKAKTFKGGLLFEEGNTEPPQGPTTR